jgi:hypothetical protein
MIGYPRVLDTTEIMERAHSSRTALDVIANRQQIITWQLHIRPRARYWAHRQRAL